jgi:hypothetical protein
VGGSEIAHVLIDELDRPFMVENFEFSSDRGTLMVNLREVLKTAFVPPGSTETPAAGRCFLCGRRFLLRLRLPFRVGFPPGLGPDRRAVGPDDLMGMAELRRVARRRITSSDWR